MNKKGITKFLVLLPILGFIMLLFLIAYSIEYMGEESSEHRKDH
jgi:hypothetical protein